MAPNNGDAAHGLLLFFLFGSPLTIGTEPGICKGKTLRFECGKALKTLRFQSFSLAYPANFEDREKIPIVLLHRSFYVL